MNSVTKRYISRVSRRMPVGGSQKKQFLSKLGEDVDHYIGEHPDTTMP